MNIEFAHTPVMADEVMQLLDVKRGGIFVDGTLGGGGHASIIKSLLPQGSRLIGIDRDGDAIKAAGERLGEGVTLIRGNFFDMKDLLFDIGIRQVDSILLDLGVSSYQLDNPLRGFSYVNDAPLDMRMDTRSALSAYTVVNEYSEAALVKLLFEYGEEKFARRIAAAIIAARPVKTTLELSEIVKNAIPAPARRTGGNPSKRTFQALRIEVNSELSGLEAALERAVGLLSKDGRIAVITFHSLEDRIVKTTFNRLQNPCTCPPKAPVCVCGKKPVIKNITRKPVTASEQELERNPRSHSAKLRVAQKL